MVGGSQLRHRPSERGVRPDLAGSYAIGRQRDWTPISEARKCAEQMGVYVNAVLRAAAPALKQRFIAERLSATAPQYIRGGVRKGYKWNKLPLAAGLRRYKGFLQGSVRMTVTSPGTNARNFRGRFNLSSKVGGGQAHYAAVHEKSGRMQFGRVTGDEYERLNRKIRIGLAQIAARFGAVVR